MVEFTNFGFFEHKNPGQKGWAIYENEEGLDYETSFRALIMSHEDGIITETIYGAWVSLETDGTVRNVDADPTAVVPRDAYVLGIDMDPAEIHVGMIWDEETTSFLAPTAPEIVIPDLSPRQFELMLRQIGMDASHVEAQIASMPDEDDREIALIEFRRATTFERDHWAVAPIAAALGFTSEEMDTMWTYAASI